MSGYRMIVDIAIYCGCGRSVKSHRGGGFHPTGKGATGGLIPAIEHFIAAGWVEIEDDVWACPLCVADAAGESVPESAAETA